MSVRPVRVVGDLAYVTLTRGYEAIVDASDVHLVEGLNWYAKVQSNSAYAATMVRHPDGSRSVLLMHRHILKPAAHILIDHINSNGTDNRRSNLRHATPMQNQQNQKLLPANTSGFKGVSWHKKTGKWRACLRYQGKVKSLGYFTDIQDAAAAYAAGSAKYHGEFRRSA